MKFWTVNSSQTSAFPTSSSSAMASFFDAALTAEKSPFLPAADVEGHMGAPAAIIEVLEALVTPRRICEWNRR
jgi:hypothetical protein